MTTKKIFPLTIREFRVTDIAALLRYWAETSDGDLVRLGELARPDPQTNRDFLEWFCTTRPSLAEAGEDIRVWESDGDALGYSTLKEATVGATGQIHLHMWAKERRGRGLGAGFFALSALSFMNTHQLHSLYCQPHTENPMPNRMLARMGFPNEGPVLFRRADGSTVTQNRYTITRPIVDKWIAQNRAYFQES